MTPDSKAESLVAVTRKIVQILRYGPRELALALLGLLLLLGAIPLLSKLVEMLPFLAPAQPWMTGVLAVLGLFLLGSSILRIWKMVVAPLPEGKPKPAAIKGPAPFGPQDAELFARLGRNDDLDRLRGWILDDQKPLVALMGESGVGKTSLLRAGLAHHLQDDKVPVLYWEAVPTEPEAKLLHAVRVGWEDEEKAPKTFEELASAVASGCQVVVIDQAEQLSPEGHPRIFELLRQVATMDPPYRATWVVAFRREFLPVWRDFELSLPEAVQRRMETLSLQRFLPKAAEKVIAVLVEEGNLPVDQKLVEELVKGEAVDGKVSPADIGISLLVLSELAGGLPDGSLSLDDFRESGGQAGLLTRYLERLLEQLPEAERPEVLRGLLALIDLERDQRLAEGRTLAGLEEAVKPASPSRFAAALRFLASGKARVLEELPGEPARYRLVHERLIPAVRKLTGVLLAEAERASLSLERGYRVWAQDRQSRYLLHRKDLEVVSRFREQIQWGREEADKREFVRLSRRRERWRRLSVVAALVAAFSILVGLGEFTRKREYQSLLSTWGLPPDLYDHLGQLEELTLPGTVTRLDWLRSANRLKKLTIEDGSLVSLEGLPESLEKLRVGNSRLSDLSGLPAALSSLSIGASHIKDFQPLPGKVEHLALNLGDELLDLKALPGSLVSLHLEARYSLDLDLLEEDFRILDNLRSLSLRLPGAENMPFEASLPERLRALGLWGPDVTNLEQLPTGLEFLSLVGAISGESLNSIPKSLKHLQIMPEIDSSTHEVLLSAVPLAEFKALRSLRLVLVSEFSDLDVSGIPASVTSLVIFATGGVRIKGLSRHLRGFKISAKWVLLSEGLPPGLTRLELPHGVLVDNRQKTWNYLIDRSSTDTDTDFWSVMERPVRGFSPSLVSLSITRPREEDLIFNLAGMPALDKLSRLVGLRRLRLNSVGIQQVPASLELLQELSIRGEQVHKLPSLKSLIRLDISETLVQTLAGLPPRLESLTLGTNQVRNLEGLPLGVTALHFHGTPSPVSTGPW